MHHPASRYRTPSRLLALALLVTSCGASTGSTPSPSQVEAKERTRGPDVLAWVLPYADSLKSLERNAAWLTIVSPTYFRLAVVGKTVRLEDWDPAVPFPRAPLESIRARSSFSVLPMVGCIGTCGPLISRVLEDDRARTGHIADLVRVAREQQLDGLFLDYEDVDASEASVTRFLTDLASALHASGKRLGLAVQEPCGVDPACARAPFPFALRPIADMVDHLAVMEYDFSVDGSAPPAPRDWVSRGLAKVVGQIGDEPKLRKILCGLPLYGRVSAGIAGDTAVLFGDIKPGQVRSAQVAFGTFAFEPSVLSKRATVTPGAKSGTLYLEDHETLAARLELASTFKLGGVALWRLGSEDPCVGGELARYRGLAGPACK
jgi:spore germination protein YaaH